MDQTRRVLISLEIDWDWKEKKAKYTRDHTRLRPFLANQSLSAIVSGKPFDINAMAPYKSYNWLASNTTNCVLQQNLLSPSRALYQCSFLSSYKAMEADWK